MILRDVIKRHYWTPRSAPHGGQACTLTLSCGHENRRKASQAEVRRVACRECERDAESRRLYERSG